MSKIAYVSHAFSPKTLAIIEQAETICNEYEQQGFILTLRQLYYQFVSRDLIDNKQSEYKRLGSIINDARLAGLIDWDHVEDRTRNLQSLSNWRGPASIVGSAARSYHIDFWEDQEYRVEVWIEKDSLVGVIENACQDLDVPYFSCRGYTSQSELWGAAMRIEEHYNKDQTPIVIHLGDHDPSGIDMTRDIQDRLDLFHRGHICEVQRIALNENQVRQYRPPPNPAKLTDSRVAGYMAKFGMSSWELDALSPTVIDNLIREAIGEYIDDEKFQAQKDREASERKVLSSAARHWEHIDEIIHRAYPEEMED